MQAPLEKERLHRFVRRPLTCKFYPTERDEAVLVELFYERFRTTAQLQALFGPWIDERLTLMFKAGLIDRPDAQWVWRRQKGGGSKPLVHALSQQGYEHLRMRGLVPRTNCDFSERNRELSDYSSHIPHELRIGDVRRSHSIQDVPSESSGSCTSRSSRADRTRERSSCLAASASSILIGRLPSPRGKHEPNLFFAEINMGSEPNGRHAASELQHLEYKYDAYLRYAHSKRCVEQFDVSNFRVLTITAGGEQKVEHVAEAASRICDGVGVGRFLVTNFTTLLSGDPLKIRWLYASGTRVRLEI